MTHPPHLDINSTVNIEAQFSYFDWIINVAYIYLGYQISYYTGSILAILCVVAIQQAKVVIFEKLLGLSSLQPMDFFFLYDNYKNRANIILVAVTNNIDVEMFRKRFRERALKFPRMRQRLVRYLGEYYWQEMP